MPNAQPSPHRWSQIQRLPLHPHIRTVAQYEEAVLVGGADALAFMRATDPKLTPDNARSVHYLHFRGVHPWAGSFRAFGQLTVVAGYPAADPGRINRVWFNVDKPGTYQGQCAELCGVLHAQMFITVNVVTPEEFDRWIEQKKKGA